MIATRRVLTSVLVLVPRLRECWISAGNARVRANSYGGTQAGLLGGGGLLQARHEQPLGYERMSGASTDAASLIGYRLVGARMSRRFFTVLIFLAVGLRVRAQTPAPGAAPVPLFSADVIKSFTPADNPITDAKAKLGDMIFDEKRISIDNSLACNTCHSPRNGFTTHTAASRGVGDQIGKRNAPSILNAMFYKSMFWDGRAASLEEQSTLPILNSVEMGQKDPKDVVAKLTAIPEFVEAFQKVFGRPPNWEDVGKALGAFERTRLSTE